MLQLKVSRTSCDLSNLIRKGKYNKYSKSYDLFIMEVKLKKPTVLPRLDTVIKTWSFADITDFWLQDCFSDRQRQFDKNVVVIRVIS